MIGGNSHALLPAYPGYPAAALWKTPVPGTYRENILFEDNLKRFRQKSKTVDADPSWDYTGSRQEAAKSSEKKHTRKSLPLAKNAFPANMSHEIRTPINAIPGYAQIMKYDANLNTKQLGHLQIMGKSGKHLLSLINGILEMSKIEADRVVIESNTFNIRNMDGPAATRQTRNLPQGKTSVVIAVSASSLDKQRINKLEYGADAFIKKPIKEEELFDLLRNLLNLVFIYKGKNINTTFEKQLTKLHQDDVENLPLSLKKNIFNACVIGNLRQLKRFTDEISKFDPVLAESYQDHLSRYDIKNILKVFSS